MNKSNRRRQRNWWQNVSTSSKVFCIVGGVLVVVMLLVCYLVGMASDPKVVEKVVVTAFVLLVIVLVITFVACSVSDRVELGALRNEVTELIRAEAAKVKAEAEYYYDAVEEGTLQEIDLEDGEKPIETLSEEQLAELRAEIETGREVNKTAGQDILERRYAKQTKEHEDTKRRTAEEEVKKAKKPLVAAGGSDQPNNVVVAEISPGERTGEIDVKIIKGAIHDHIDGNQPKNHPDSPEEQPKVWPSVEEQAKELGISRSFLQYKLSMAGVPHYSLLSGKDQDDVDLFRQRGMNANAAIGS